MFENCIFEDYLYFLGCHTPTISGTEISSVTNDTDFNGYDIVLKNNEFDENVYYSMECFIKSDRLVAITENTFNIDHNQYVNCSLNIDLEHDDLSEFLIFKNDFFASSDCINGTRCAEGAICIETINSTTSSKVNVSLNIYGDEVYGFGDIKIQDFSVYRIGLKIFNTDLSFLETFLEQFDSSPPAYQRVPRNLKDFNPLIFGDLYDILVVETDLVEKCEGVCKDRCDGCLVDPTRFDSIHSGVCENLSLFEKLGVSTVLCVHENIYLFSTNYTGEIISINKSVNILKIYWKTFPGVLFDPQVNELTVDPTIDIKHVQEPSILETESHSIYLNADEISFQNIIFTTSETHEPPWFGSTFFSTILENPNFVTTLEFLGCTFITTSVEVVVFDPVDIDDRVSNLYFYWNIFDGVTYDITPDIIKNFVCANNFFQNMAQGIVEVEIVENIIFENNTGFEVTRNFDCEGIVCIEDASCNGTTIGPCSFKNNSISGTFSSVHAVYKLENCAFEEEDIQDNSCVDFSQYGLEYLNMPLIPCNFTNMFTLKMLNMGFDGFLQDIICDRGLPTEKFCSGMCLPPLIPPAYCIVNSSIQMMDPGYFHTSFPTIKDALKFCTSNPNEYIRILPGDYHESNLEFVISDIITQTKIQMEPFTPEVDVVNIFGVLHVTSNTFEELELNYLNFYSQEFNASTVFMDEFAILSGSVQKFIARNLLFQSVGNPDNTPVIVTNEPDVQYLISINVGGEIVRLENVMLFGSRVLGLRIFDVNQLNVLNSTEIQLINILGKSHWQSFIDLIGVGNTLVNNTECSVWCGKLGPMESVFRIINKEVFSLTSKLYMEIDGFIVNITNSAIQTSGLSVQSGIGYISGVWIENPVLGDDSLVDTFKIRNLVSFGYPVGFRYIDVSDTVLLLNEPIGSFPISYDFKRGMRETVRYNIIEGTIYDVKNGAPFIDDLLHPINTCNDLCLPEEGEVCEVHKDFDLSISGFGFRRFSTIQDAIDDCISISIPMPIKLILDEGMLVNGDLNLVIEQEHEEDVCFNATKDILLYGPVSVLDGSRIVLLGRHKIQTGQDYVITIRGLELLIDERIVDRTIPLLYQSNLISLVEYDIFIENVIFSTGYNVMDSNTELLAPLTFLIMGSTFSMDNVLIEKGFFVETNAVIEIEFEGSGGISIFNDVLMEHCLGPAILIINSIDFTLTNNVFTQCAVGNSSYLGCIIVFNNFMNDGIILSDNNELTRTNALITGKIGDFYFSGLIYYTQLTVNTTDRSELGNLLNITDWKMSNNVPVGIRIIEVNFTSQFLLLAQSQQKTSIKQISLNNLQIVSTFHDIVYNLQDPVIESDPGNNERLFCSDGCGILSFKVPMGYFFLILGIVLLILLVICVFFPFGVCLYGRARFKIESKYGVGYESTYSRRRRFQGVLNSDNGKGVIGGKIKYT